MCMSLTENMLQLHSTCVTTMGYEIWYWQHYEIKYIGDDLSLYLYLMIRYQHHNYNDPKTDMQTLWHLRDDYNWAQINSEMPMRGSR